MHFVVSLDSTRATLPEYSAFSGLRAEIQVRTVLQHAWAAIDHKLRYKSKEEIPPNLRRQLYRISALLETADEQFESLNERLEEVREEYSAAVTQGSLELPLNVESLKAYISTSENAKELLKKSELLDINFAPHHPNARLPEFSHLLAFLDSAEIETLREFDEDLSTVSARAAEILADIVEKWKENVSNPALRLVVTNDSFFRMMYFISLPPDRAEHLIEELRFGPALGDAVEKAYRRVHDCPTFTIGAQQDAGGNGE